LKALVRSAVRYVYWKVNAYDDDPGMQAMRRALMDEALKLIDKTASSVVADYIASRDPVEDKNTLN
jgi:hypothetical protein